MFKNRKLEQCVHNMHMQLSDLQRKVHHLEYRLNEDIKMTNYNLDIERKTFKAIADHLGMKIVKRKELNENDEIVEIIKLEKIVKK